MRQRRTFYTNKRGNTSKGNNNYQPICTQCQRTQFHQTYPEGPKNINRLQHSNTVVVGDFNIPLSPKDRSSKQKINKEILDLKHTIEQIDLVDVYRTLHPTSTQYTFFSAAHGTFSKIDHILGHKASLSKYKQIKIIPCILSNHNELKLELNNKNNNKKTHKRLETEQHIAQ
jgi:exonuclease III